VNSRIAPLARIDAIYSSIRPAAWPARDIATSCGVNTARRSLAARCSAATAASPPDPLPAILRADATTGFASTSMIQKIATDRASSLVPIRNVQTPSTSVMVIAVAPDAADVARYAMAAFVSGDLAAGRPAVSTVATSSSIIGHPAREMAELHTRDARRRRVSSRGPDRRNFDSALLSFVAARFSPGPRMTLGKGNPPVDPCLRAGFRVHPRRDDGGDLRRAIRRRLPVDHPLVYCERANAGGSPIRRRRLLRRAARIAAEISSPVSVSCLSSAFAVTLISDQKKSTIPSACSTIYVRYFVSRRRPCSPYRRSYRTRR
jgi:hypothetical protein